MIPTVFDILLTVALALIVARLFGALFNRYHQPAVIGEILAGIVLGGIAIVFFSDNTMFFFGISVSFPELNFQSNEFLLFSQIGILFMLFLSGLQTSFSKVKKMGKQSLYTAVGGVIVPFIFGYVTGFAFGFSITESVIIGLVLMATSVGVSVRTMLDLHVLDSDVGTTILGAAVIDDVLSIIFLTLVLGIETLVGNVILSVGLLSFKIVLFFIIFLYLGLRIIDKVLELGERIHLPKAFLSISLAILLIYSFFAHSSGISGLIGAFVAGVLIGNTVHSRKILNDVEAIGYGFFIPLFFVWVGARVYEGAHGDIGWYVSLGFFSLAIIFVAVVGKIIGCGMGGKIGGLSNRESLQVGVGMIPRLEVALIIVSTALTLPYFADRALAGHQILTMTILLSIVTAILTPVFIKYTFREHQ